MKTNCWDHMLCGRELSGDAVKQFGVCPVVKYSGYNRVNGGYNGGRYCWRLVGTFIDEVCCPKALELGDCKKCEFYQIVKHEEGESFTP
jgi:hypothetical protein